MSYDSEALAGFDEFFGRVLASLSPARRRRASMKLGQALRRSNLARIRANIQPDGTAMEPRKPRLDRRGRLKKKQGGRMFRMFRLAKMWKIDAQPDSVEIFPAKADNVARIHHFGLPGTVGRDRQGRAIKYRYPSRRLLGFAPEDERLALQVAEEMLGLDG
ncbi:phage virion morphogenesis protein [Alteraurantiacibacter buctensis]|uniref:Phage virion morphogenesis protein n=1 Tax=Alteraurantiacibacter buctensis TaxID=1503981 RepID=A0A844Z4G1_9SPHN|nr:phage virion morphogenesis protein [Alteraurantiacibacter buctensis]MXO73564.1 phage virion morphogenesis protein [Alteraurantiacibacter buctensis]